MLVASNNLACSAASLKVLWRHINDTEESRLFKNSLRHLSSILNHVEHVFSLSQVLLSIYTGMSVEQVKMIVLDQVIPLVVYVAFWNLKGV